MARTWTDPDGREWSIDTVTGAYLPEAGIAATQVRFTSDGEERCAVLGGEAAGLDDLTDAELQVLFDETVEGASGETLL